MKAIFFNCSPRKNKNTALMLRKAMEGAAAVGAETELVHIYDIQFQGCKSCFACKLKNSKTDGICAIKDDLRPVLERARQADVVVIGSPVYYSYPTGMMRSLFERLLFPIGTYHYENGVQKVLRTKVIPSAMIFTMNCPEDYMAQIGYPPVRKKYELVGSHTARRSGATELARRDVPIATISKLMNHTNTLITSRYIFADTRNLGEEAMSFFK